MKSNQTLRAGWLLVLLVPSLTGAVELHDPEEIPDDLTRLWTQRLTKRRGELIDWKTDLTRKIADFNRDGHKAPPEKWADLERRETLLLEEVGYYNRAVRYFKDDVKTAADACDSVSKFMYDEEFLELLGGEPRIRWPKRRHARLLNPLDKDQGRRDRELMRPLRPHDVRDLSIDDVAKLINERTHARIREAQRSASRAMNRATKKLEASLEPGETLLQKEASDPTFRALLHGITGKIAKQEYADVLAAEDQAFEEFDRIVEIREAEKDPVRVRRMLAESGHILTRRHVAIDQARVQLTKDVRAALDRLKREGYYTDQKDLVKKIKSDPRLRKAMNAAVSKAVQRQANAEALTFTEALHSLTKVMREFYGN